MRLVDTHFHFDFIKEESERASLLAYLANNEVEIVAQTVLPSDYVTLSRRKRHVPAYLSLGFHPWWIGGQSEIDQELALFKKLLETTSFIGEIGLDFSPSGLKIADQDQQVALFRQLLDIINNGPSPSYLLSIHAVRSANEVLDIIEKTEIKAKKIVPILHRFNGSSDELTRLIRHGGYLSVHPRHFQSKKGRAYMKQVPADRLLLESDLPDQESNQSGEELAMQLSSSLQTSFRQLEDLRGEDLSKTLNQTQKQWFYPYTNRLLDCFEMPI